MTRWRTLNKRARRKQAERMAMTRNMKTLLRMLEDGTMSRIIEQVAENLQRVMQTASAVMVATYGKRPEQSE